MHYYSLSLIHFKADIHTHQTWKNSFNLPRSHGQSYHVSVYQKTITFVIQNYILLSFAFKCKHQYLLIILFNARRFNIYIHHANKIKHAKVLVNFPLEASHLRHYHCSLRIVKKTQKIPGSRYIVRTSILRFLNLLSKIIN